jgi:hypothetical protein
MIEDKFVAQPYDPDAICSADFFDDLVTTGHST